MVGRRFGLLFLQNTFIPEDREPCMKKFSECESCRQNFIIAAAITAIIVLLVWIF